MNCRHGQDWRKGRDRFGFASGQAFLTNSLLFGLHLHSLSLKPRVLRRHLLFAALEEKNMRREGKYLASFFLSAALLAPVGAMAMPRPQDDHERHEQEERERRVYDPYHKDYHNWDQREDQAYRHWLEGKQEGYV